MANTQTTPIELSGFRHPVTQQRLMLPPAEAEAYLHFTRAFREELRPVGILEEQLAQSLADAQWRMNYARALENNIFATESAAYAEAPVVAAHRNARYGNAIAFSSYEQRLNRQFHQNLKLLRELQAERRQTETADLERAAQILQLEKTKSAPSKPLTWIPQDDGFVFSIAQIETHIRLRDRRRAAAQLPQSHKAAA